MGRLRRIFAYTLSPREYRLWSVNFRSGKKWRKHIEGCARQRARSSGKNVALILSPEGQELAEVLC